MIGLETCQLSHEHHNAVVRMNSEDIATIA
jgi:hypothetical protein